jgi:ATP-dependent RNA helicase DDX46/PRP5
LEGSKQEVPEELRVMAKSFEEKLKTGEAKKISSGYGGSGFKFDETEMTAEQKAEAAAKRQYELESGIAVEEVGEASGKSTHPPSYLHLDTFRTMLALASG